MSPRKLHNPWLVAAFAGGLLYPLLVYYGRSVLPPVIFVMVGLALIGLRLLALRHRPEAQIWKIAFLIAALVLICLLFLDAQLAMLVYPVAVSLSVAAVFGFSLLFPPTLVERIARLSEPDLPPSGVIYTRRVTIVWTVFLFTNAAISAATAIWGTMAQWALWNSLISYLLMGTLFTIEFLIRRTIRQRVRS